MAANVRYATSGRTLTPAERAAASRVVLRNARGRDDLRLLLDALGLTASKEAGPCPTTTA